jgi:hypothetical protein
MSINILKLKFNLLPRVASQFIVVRNFSLSDQQFNLRKLELEHYEEDGFFVIRKLISEEKLDKFKKRFQKICNEKIKVQGMTVMKDVSIAKKSDFKMGENMVTKIQDFCYDDELFEFCQLPELLEYVKPFTGENVMAMHTMLINKPPGKIKHSKFVYLLKQKKEYVLKHKFNFKIRVACLLDIRCIKTFTIFHLDQLIR